MTQMLINEHITLPHGFDLVRVLRKSKLSSGGGEARRLIHQRAVTVNGIITENPATVIPVGVHEVRVGRRRLSVVTIVDEAPVTE